MTILVWIIVGLIAGFIASHLMGAGGYGIFGDIIVGMIGAVVGGWLLAWLLGIGVTGLNLESIFVSVVGAIIVIVVYRALAGTGRRRWI
ncbi:MAG: GlsB/YeaQ/YmgE family stress response membrane protein [Dehalococcoidia bacterium]|nr:GlsB/YeaQ/YmgE family stress response membrane protein [Dehalococcoidia bacterium]